MNLHYFEEEQFSSSLILCDFPGGAMVTNLFASTGDMGLIPGSGRSPGEGNDNPL